MERAHRQQLERQYEELWRDHGPGLSRLAALYESSLQAREDLLQDIRLAIWRALPNFRGECSVRTFVYRISHNRSLTHVWRRRTALPQTEEPYDVPDPGPDPEVSTIIRMDHSKLMQAIRGLPLPYRQVITMVLEELPQAEIAAVLGISENNVAVRLNRARNLLREKLEGKSEHQF
ncbi:MAG TPA: RNA polymerase sigma factor [Candidatus Angelobacter sp.]